MDLVCEVILFGSLSNSHVGFASMHPSLQLHGNKDFHLLMSQIEVVVLRSARRWCCCSSAQPSLPADVWQMCICVGSARILGRKGSVSFLCLSQNCSHLVFVSFLLSPSMRTLFLSPQHERQHILRVSMTCTFRNPGSLPASSCFLEW